MSGIFGVLVVIGVGFGAWKVWRWWKGQPDAAQRVGGLLRRLLGK